MNNPMRVLVIGIGPQGKNLANAALSLGNHVVICDTDKQRLKAFSLEKGGLVQIDDYRSCDAKKFDYCIVATPPETHFEISKFFLSQGLAVLVEKPISKTIEEIEQLNALSKSSNATIMVGHLRMFDKGFNWIKERVGDRLESVHFLSLQNNGSPHANTALWDLAPHDLSLIDFFIGLDNSDTIYAINGGLDKTLNNVLVQTAHCGGISSSFHVSWRWPVKRRESVFIMKNERIIYDGITGEVRVFDSDGVMLESFFSPRDALIREISHFEDCLRNNLEPLAGLEHATRVTEYIKKLEVLLTADRS